MNARPAIAAACLAAAAVIAAPSKAPPAPKPQEDVFDFIPQGGRTLLASVATTGASAEEVRAIVAGKRSADEWAAHLKAREAKLPGVKALDDKERRTLAEYLASNMPLAPGKAPAATTRAAWEKALPPDGRDFALDYCQGCHIITVVVTQDRTKTAWLGTLGKPSHVGIKLSKDQREALVNYLVLNAAIPIDQVPEDLRAGGATY